MSGRRLAKAADSPGLRLAQEPEARAPERAQPLVAFLPEQIVLPVSEEREVVVADPVEEGASSGELGLVQGRRVRFELREHRPEALPHRLPVLDRGAHVREHASDPGGDLVENPLLGLAIHFDVDDGLGDRLAALGSGQDAFHVPVHAHHRMDDEVGGE